ncbi:MAG: DUF2231 domain-containing protein [Chromatiaceae bacterium]|nr:DUF2231 domain-containing protein [Chromatiaceae bacterium]
MLDIAHIHPMLVHFPLALLPLAVTAQAISLATEGGLFGRNCSARMGMGILAVTAVAAILAAIFGDMAFDQALAAGVPEAAMEDHEHLGMLSAIALAGLAAVESILYLRSDNSRLISVLLLIAGFGLLSVLLATAWFGGHLVYDLGINVAQDL